MMKIEKDYSFRHTIVYGIQKYIESETSKEGKINFAFGLILSGLFIITCIPTWISYIIKLIYPGCDILMPWYGLLIFFAIVVYYFVHCSKSVMKIMAQRGK